MYDILFEILIFFFQQLAVKMKCLTAADSAPITRAGDMLPVKIGAVCRVASAW